MADRARIALVTGAASGIGAAVAHALAGPDMALMLHTRANRAGLDAVAHQLRQTGTEVEIALGDLTDPAVPGVLVTDTVARFGGLDVLISNAGFADRTPFAELSDAGFTRSVEAIQGAFFRLARAAMPHLRNGRDARVVAVSSFVAHTFRTDTTTFPASAAAKAALEALVRALAIELGPDGVTVNTVVPGFIRKDAGTHRSFDPAVLQQQAVKMPLRRIGLPQEVAAAIAFLASPAAGYITGQALHVDGGLVI